MRFAIIALSAFALAATPAAVSARDMVVKHSDLDLSTKHDQKVLRQRIAKASRDFCGETAVRTGTRVRHQDEIECVAQTRKLAFEQMASLVDQSRKGG